MASGTSVLPDGFEDMLPFVGKWAKPTVNERMEARGTSTMQEIEQFYGVMIGRAKDVIDYLDKFPLKNMPEDAGQLFLLLLALAQASIAIEIQGRPFAANATYPFGVALLGGVAPFG